MKNKKWIVLFVVFFLAIVFSSGTDNTWFEIFTGATLYSVVTTLLSFLVYRLFQFISFAVKKQYN